MFKIILKFDIFIVVFKNMQLKLKLKKKKSVKYKYMQNKVIGLKSRLHELNLYHTLVGLPKKCVKS